MASMDKLILSGFWLLVDLVLFGLWWGAAWLGSQFSHLTIVECFVIIISGWVAAMQARAWRDRLEGSGGEGTE